MRVTPTVWLYFSRCVCLPHAEQHGTVVARDSCNVIFAGGPPGWDASFRQVAEKEPLEDQWQYHAVTAALNAHTLLAAHPAVDAGRIGLTGISWGGYMTCVVAGVDPRYRFAVPVYGCGFLALNSAWSNSGPGSSTQAALDLRTEVSTRGSGCIAVADSWIKPLSAAKQCGMGSHASRNTNADCGYSCCCRLGVSGTLDGIHVTTFLTQLAARRSSFGSMAQMYEF
jgi:hypothetical protein